MQAAVRDRIPLQTQSSATLRRGRVLLAVHGAARGPHRPLRQVRPLAEPDGQTAVWETGNPKPDLSGVETVLFLLRDRLRERFPECYGDAVELAEQARNAGIRVINPPESLSNTVKSVQSRLWREAALPTPVVYPFRNTMEMRDAGAMVHFPALLRADRMHGDSEARIVRSRQQLHDMDPELIAFPGSLTAIEDVRADYLRRDPGSEFERFHHVKQALVCGDQVQFRHLYFSDSPIVDRRSATIRGAGGWNPLRQLEARLRWRRHLRLEEEFQRDGEPCAGLLVRAVRALGLECAVVHYSTLAGNRTILWKAHTDFLCHERPRLQSPAREVFRSYLQSLTHSSCRTQY